MVTTRIAVLGCGGIGSRVAPEVARMYAGATNVEIYLIDGKIVRLHNVARQFDRKAVGTSKAQVLADQIAPIIGEGTTVHVVGEFLEPDTLDAHRGWLKDGTIVLSGLDNGVSRILLEDEMQELRDCTLISAGNEVVDGQVTLWRRKGGKNLTPLLSEIHPSMLDADDKYPSQVPCDESYVSLPQLPMSNMAAALGILMLLRTETSGEGDAAHNEITFNVVDHVVHPHERRALVHHGSKA